MRFYASRMLRLFPLYYVTLVLTIAALLWIGDDLSDPESIRYRRARLDMHRVDTLFLYWFTNLFILGQDVMRFMLYDPDHGGRFYFAAYNTVNHASLYASGFHMVSQCWTVSLEIIFYLLAPFLLRLPTRWLTVLCLLSASLKYAIMSSSLPTQNIYWCKAFFPAELCSFLAGAIACRFRNNKLFIVEQTDSRRRYSGLLIGYILISSTPIMTSPWMRYYLFAFVSAPLIPVLFNLSRDNRFDRFVGELSYPAYLIHFLIIGLLMEMKMRAYFIGIVATVLTLAFSAFLHYLIEVPIDSFRHRRFKTSPTLHVSHFTVQ